MALFYLPLGCSLFEYHLLHFHFTENSHGPSCVGLHPHDPSLSLRCRQLHREYPAFGKCAARSGTEGRTRILVRLNKGIR